MKDSDFWCTPPEVLEFIPKPFFDPCPKDPIFDGLKIHWKFKTVFVNPPYSQIELWLDKATNELRLANCEEVIFLLPNWTDRAWFQQIKNCPIHFFQGRLKFIDPKTGLRGKYNPRFGSMLVKLF